MLFGGSVHFNWRRLSKEHAVRRGFHKLLISKVILMRSECRKVVRDYIKRYNPYVPAPKLGYNIAEMCRYVAKSNRKASELNPEEVDLFTVN